MRESRRQSSLPLSGASLDSSGGKSRYCGWFVSLCRGCVELGTVLAVIDGSMFKPVNPPSSPSAQVATPASRLESGVACASATDLTHEEMPPSYASPLMKPGTVEWLSWMAKNCAKKTLPPCTCSMCLRLSLTDIDARLILHA